MFDDILEANERYWNESLHSRVVGRASTGIAAAGLAVLTCMDTRLDPLAMLGLQVGDAKIIRNAGARVTDDALRSLVLATTLLGVTRVAVIGHTRCAMYTNSEADLQAKVGSRTGSDASGWTFMAATDQAATIRADIEAITSCELIPDEVEVSGFVFDVDSGAIVPLDQLDR